MYIMKKSITTDSLLFQKTIFDVISHALLIANEINFRIFPEFGDSDELGELIEKVL